MPPARGRLASTLRRTRAHALTFAILGTVVPACRPASPWGPSSSAPRQAGSRASSPAEPTPAPLVLGPRRTPRCPDAPREATPAPPPDPSRPTLTKEEIRTVVQSHLHEVRACYRAGLSKDADLAGCVKFQFVIVPDGRTGTIEVAYSDLPQWAKPVETCIVDAIGTWRFPKPPAGRDLVVSYPFVLVP